MTRVIKLVVQCVAVLAVASTPQDFPSRTIVHPQNIPYSPFTNEPYVSYGRPVPFPHQANVQTVLHRPIQRTFTKCVNSIVTDSTTVISTLSVTVTSYTREVATSTVTVFVSDYITEVSTVAVTTITATAVATSTVTSAVTTPTVTDPLLTVLAIQQVCKFNGEIYQSTQTLSDACATMLCNDGEWRYNKSISENCGKCVAWGDPHVVPFQVHYLSDGQTTKTIRQYDTFAQDTFYLSVPNRDADSATFGVYATFITCFKVLSCVGQVTYFEDGITVELILPTQLFGSHCNNVPETDPDCLTGILVNGEAKDIDDSGTVYTHDGKVMIFKDKCSHWVCNIFVVGSNGYTLKLRVELRFNYALDIYAWPSLKTKLYGLCDVYTGENADSFTMLDDGTITDPSKIPEFVESWNKNLRG